MSTQKENGKKTDPESLMLDAYNFPFNTEETFCPLCSSVLGKLPKGSAILFVCVNCGFKILTIKELFKRCFRKQAPDSTFTSSERLGCGGKMCYCHSGR